MRVSHFAQQAPLCPFLLFNLFFERITKMKVSPEILIGLKRVGNLLNDDNLDIILNEISSYLEFSLNPNCKIDIPKTARIDVLKECYASILTLLIEGMRWNKDPIVLKNILLDQKIEDKKIDKILDIYTKQKLPLRLALKNFNSDPPHVFDITWKMHYCLKSSFSDFDTKILYFIELTVGKNNGHDQKINFVCTVNQLQSLVASLKAAVQRLKAIAE